MILIKSDLYKLFDNTTALIMLIHVAISIEKQKNNAVLIDKSATCMPECIIKPSDIPQLSRHQYRCSLEKLSQLKIITSTTNPTGTKIRLLPNDYIAFSNTSIQTEIQALTPISQIEKGILIGQFDMNVCKPEYIGGGIPEYVLCNMTKQDKEDFFNAIKTELDGSEILIPEAARIGKTDEITAKLLYDNFTSEIHLDESYLEGIRRVKKDFIRYIKRHLKDGKLKELGSKSKGQQRMQHLADLANLDYDQPDGVRKEGDNSLQ